MLEALAYSTAWVKDRHGVDVQALGVEDLGRDDLHPHVRETLQLDLMDRRGVPQNQVMKPGDTVTLAYGGGFTGIWCDGWHIEYDALKPVRNRHLAAGATREEAMRRAVIELMMSGKANRDGTTRATDVEIDEMLGRIASQLESFDRQMEEEADED
jgi:hypothetical protein